MAAVVSKARRNELLAAVARRLKAHQARIYCDFHDWQENETETPWPFGDGELDQLCEDIATLIEKGVK